MRDLTGFQGANIVARDVAAVICEAAEENADLFFRYRQELFGILGVADFPTAFSDQPLDERHDSIRQASVDGNLRDALAAVGPRNRQSNQIGLAIDRWRAAIERRVSSLAGLGVVLHFGMKSVVDAMLDGLQSTEAGG